MKKKLFINIVLTLALMAGIVYLMFAMYNTEHKNAEYIIALGLTYVLGLNLKKTEKILKKMQIIL